MLFSFVYLAFWRVCSCSSEGGAGELVRTSS